MRRRVPPALAALAAALVGGGAIAGPAPLGEARSHLAGGHAAEAEELARDLLAAGSADSADVLDVLVEALLARGKGTDPEVRRFAERALALRERLLGSEHPGLAPSLHNLGVLFQAVNEPAGARAAYERALGVREKALGPDHPDVAASLNDLGSLANGTDDYAGARVLHERALAIQERALGPEHPEVARTLNYLANSVSALGDYVLARSLCERALAIRERALGPEHPEVARSLMNLANQLERTGDYIAARASLERAIAINEAALGPDHPDLAKCLNNLGMLLGDEGDFAGAAALHARALGIRERVRGPEHFEVAMSLNNLGTALLSAGDPGRARPLFERAYAIWERAFGPDRPQVAMALSNLGTVEAKLGHLVAATPLLERALAIREKAFGPDHLDVAKSLGELASVLAAAGDLARAASLHERALAIRERAVGPDHPLVAQSLNSLAALSLRRGDGAKAAALALRGEETGREHLRLTSRALAEREALGYAAVRTTGLDVALSVAARGGDPALIRSAWDALIRSRALVLDEMCARHRAWSGTADPEVARLAQGLAGARQRLADLMVRGSGGLRGAEYRRLLDQDRAGKEAAERALAAASAAFRSEQERSRIGFADVAAALPPGSALVAFASYDRVDAVRAVPSYLAFILASGSSGPTVVPLGPAAAIDTLVVARWRDEAARGVLDLERPERAIEAAYRAAGEALRRAIWDPVALQLGGAARVFVVADGALHLVSLAALPAGESGYLVEGTPVFHSLSVERDLVPSAGDTRPGSGLLALGGPDYDAGTLLAGGAPPAAAGGPWFRGGHSDCGDFRARRFEPLPGAAREAAEVASIWRARDAVALALTGAEASEAAFKSQSPGRGVLHLATHGFFLSGRCDGENPLHLSGLALAGANQRNAARPDEEDGILTAEEIATLDLSGVEWAVLSGCDTGIGEIAAGEGVLGLRRAFQVAGAGTLIMSLWAVDDESAREWMQGLYEQRLRDHVETARAVQEASRAALRARRERGESTHPFYWGAFVASGAWK